MAEGQMAAPALVSPAAYLSRGVRPASDLAFMLAKCIRHRPRASRRRSRAFDVVEDPQEVVGTCIGPNALGPRCELGAPASSDPATFNGAVERRG